ncbi:MAG: TOBE domain-containing protein [Pseudomonadota bacterium]|jgi:molybdate transport system regulatory protein|nr:TOBE domain-containing protein [Pseudomonadota bacterium]|tara:strand:+ start:168 stop:377 length:210 start_codon:yes stop_codon:yes gene_type:complete
MQYGAKNQLAGTVKEIKRGTVMSQVNLEVKADASMSSVLTLEALEELKISEGDQVKVIVKAVNVLLVKE